MRHWVVDGCLGEQLHHLFINGYMHRFNGHFPGKTGLAGCLLGSQSSVILMLSILVGQATTLRAHRLLMATCLKQTKVNQTLRVVFFSA